METRMGTAMGIDRKADLERAARLTDQVYQVVQDLIGCHRQLVDNVRAEKQALVAVDLKAIQEVTTLKQAMIESVRSLEQRRVVLIAELALIWALPAADLTLQRLAVQVQATDLKKADQLRSAQNTLTHLMARIQEQNRENGRLAESALEQVHQMKRNLLGATAPVPKTYGSSGKTSTGVEPGARLISTEG